MQRGDYKRVTPFAEKVIGFHVCCPWCRRVGQHLSERLIEGGVVHTETEERELISLSAIDCRCGKSFHVEKGEYVELPRRD